VLTGGGRRWWRGVTEVVGVLLGRPGPAVGRGSVRVTRNARRSRSLASSGELDGEGKNGEEDVWGGAVGGVSPFSQEWWLFIDGRGSTE
jgi:hypothetical protein